MRNTIDDGRIDSECVDEALAILPQPPIIAECERTVRHKERVECGVGIIGAAVARARLVGVVRGHALWHERQSRGSVAVMRE